jgi:serine/threonine-protein kinase
MDVQTWTTISRLLDEALDLPPGARPTWLENLSAEHEALKPRLRAMLVQAPVSANEGFLVTLPKLAETLDTGVLDTPGMLDELAEAAAKAMAPGRLGAEASPGRLRPASPDDRAPGAAGLVADADRLRPDPWLGARLGPWRVADVLGRGGMGTVYRAERADGQYAQEVAVKLVRTGPRDPYAVERFRTERQVLAHLRHPNIAGLLDGGFAADGTPYLVMELVDGVPISDWCANERLSLEARLRLFRVVCDAVHHAHRSLVVHRDLKPSNIFVSRSGSVKLLDFGIAKLLDPGQWALGAPMTRAEMRLVTPEYGSPEQVEGGPITTASDVYALGVVLYELLTGVRPRKGSGTAGAHGDGTRRLIAAPSEAVRRLARPDPAESRRLTRRIRGDLDRIVLMALRDEPERRYASAGQLGEEIDRFLEGRAIVARPDTLGYRMRTFARRNRVAVTAAVVFVACLTAFGVVTALQARALAERGRLVGIERDKAEHVVKVLVDLFEATNPAVRPDGDRMPIGEFLAGAEERSLARLGEAPLVKAKLQQVFGLIHSERGEFAPARKAFEEALSEQRRLAGPDYPDALETLLALGVATRALGDHPGARRLLDESVDRHRRVYGDEHEKTATALAALAPIVAATDLDAERALLTRVLDLRRQVLRPNDPDLAAALGALAGHHRRRGDVDRSLDLYRQAFAVFRDPSERRHPTALGLMGDYAVLLGTVRAYEEAEVLLREAIAVGEEVLGPGTLTVANLTNNHAVALTSLGRHADAERALRDAFERHVGLFGDNHWRSRNIARNIGLVLAMQRRYDEAVIWMDRAVAIRSEGSDQAGLEGIRAQRAWVVFLLGRRAEALDAVTRAVSALEAMKDANDGYALAFSRIVLGRVLSLTGRPDAAGPPLSDALAWFERWGRLHPKYVEAQCEAARAQVLRGRSEDGRAELERCLPIYRAWGQADPFVVESFERLLATPEGVRPQP